MRLCQFKSNWVDFLLRACNQTAEQSKGQPLPRIGPFHFHFGNKPFFSKSWIFPSINSKTRSFKGKLFNGSGHCHGCEGEPCGPPVSLILASCWPALELSVKINLHRVKSSAIIWGGIYPEIKPMTTRGEIVRRDIMLF